MQKIFLITFNVIIILGLAGCTAHEARSCFRSLHGCILVSAEDDEVCKNAKKYSIWKTRENETWVEEAIHRGLGCVNNEMGREVAKRLNYGSGNIYLPQDSFNNTNATAEDDFDFIEDYRQRARTLNNQIRERLHQEQIMRMEEGERHRRTY